MTQHIAERWTIHARVGSNAGWVDPVALLEHVFEQHRQLGCANQVFVTRVWREHSGDAAGIQHVYTILPLEELRP